MWTPREGQCFSHTMHKAGGTDRCGPLTFSTPGLRLRFLCWGGANGASSLRLAASAPLAALSLAPPTFTPFALAGLPPPCGDDPAGFGLGGALVVAGFSLGLAGKMGTSAGLSSGEAARGGAAFSGVAFGLGFAGLGLGRGGVAAGRSLAGEAGTRGGVAGGRRDLAVDWVSGLSNPGDAEVEALGGECRPSPATTTLERTSRPLAAPAKANSSQRECVRVEVARYRKETIKNPVCLVGRRPDISEETTGLPSASLVGEGRPGAGICLTRGPYKTSLLLQCA